MKAEIAILPGDGIGTEVIEEGVKVLNAIERLCGHSFTLNYGVVGGASIDRYGVALTSETLELCRRCHAILFGAVGGPKWDDPQAKVRPEDAILGLRKAFELFANLRPVKAYPWLATTSPLKPAILQGVDLVIVRELTGGLYFGKPKRRWTTSRGRRGVDTMAYSEGEVERILRVGFELAQRRRKRLTSVDKANILETSRLWRQIALELAPQYPEVALEHMLVDTCAMQLVSHPSRFDVIATENTFGDILTDEAAVLAGSIGLLPSASLGAGQGIPHFGLYEPIHGSAPDIAGQGKANPIGTILSVALFLRHSLGLKREAGAVEEAVEKVLEEGYRTADVMEPGKAPVSTKQMGDIIAQRVLGFLR